MPQDRIADQLAGEHRPPRRIDPHDQPGKLLLERVVEQPGDPVAARGAGSGIAIDDFARHRDHPDGPPGIGQRIVLEPGVEFGVGVGVKTLRPVVFADEFDHTLFEIGASAKFVDKPRLQGGGSQIAARRFDPSDRLVGDPRDIGGGAGLLEIGAVFFPQRLIQRTGIFARGVGHAGPAVGFDRALVFADLVDACVHLELVKQARVIEPLAPGPGNHCAAQRVDPNLAGMRGEQHAVVGIGGGIGQHGLFRGAHPVERFADRLHMHLSAAEETVEIEHHGRNPFVSGSFVKRVDHVAGLVFADRRGARKQGGDRVDLGPLLDDDAAQIEQQGAIAHGGRAGARSQHGKQGGKEQQHEDEHQPVLDANQKPPDLTSKLHASNLLLEIELGQRCGQRHWKALERPTQLD